MKKLSYLFFLLGFGFIAGCSEPDITDPNTQIKADTLAIRQYLVDNDITAIKHSSGIFYRFITEGTGTKPELYHYIRVKYKGMFMDEEMTVFDETPTTDPPYATFFLNDVNNRLIPGWRIGFPLLPEGSVAVLYIPSSLAYGKYGKSSVSGTITIPPNSNLIFEVELLDVIE